MTWNVLYEQKSTPQDESSIRRLLIQPDGCPADARTVANWQFQLAKSPIVDFLHAARWISFLMLAEPPVAFPIAAVRIIKTSTTDVMSLRADHGSLYKRHKKIWRWVLAEENWPSRGPYRVHQRTVMLVWCQCADIVNLIYWSWFKWPPILVQIIPQLRLLQFLEALCDKEPFTNFDKGSDAAQCHD